MRRLRLLRTLLLATTLVSATLAAQAAAPAGSPTTTVETVGFTVSDLDASVAFFTSVLDFAKIDEREDMGEGFERQTGVFGARARTARLRLGGEQIELSEYLTPRGQPIPVDAQSNDRAFQHIAIVTSDMDAAYARLRAARVRHVSTAPQRLPDWNPNAGGIVAFYFQDADGHNLEVIQYPAGKGDPRWQARGRLFLGIDHTAIVVASSEASLGFWRDLLGLRVVGASENWGPEQAHLNMEAGAHLRITGLRGASGPGVEFLEYVAPADGRPAPVDLRPVDLEHWQITVGNVDQAALVAGVATAGGRVASSLEEAPRHAPSVLLVRDRDGHAVLVADRP
jgi:catechol 2,3-dioxygenase-like lactoylglutathione lyase family enzyme